MALLTLSSARCRPTSTPSCSRVNQATFRPCSTACWPRASSRNVLPVPEGPQITRFSLRPIHSNVWRACWVGSGTELTWGCQASKVFPVGNAAAARRVASAERARPAASSVSRALRTSAGSQRCAFAVARTSGACRRMCGSRRPRNSSSSSSGSGGADGTPSTGGAGGAVAVRGARPTLPLVGIVVVTRSPRCVPRCRDQRRGWCWARCGRLGCARRVVAAPPSHRCLG